MATKRKPKSEPIMNAEPVHSVGVIVTHPERHITPGNASITWLVVMMAIIGAVGGFCTFIWWQKEDLNSQIEAPYMHDNSSMVGKMMRGLRERVSRTSLPVKLSTVSHTIPGLSTQLVVPAGWSVVHAKGSSATHTLFLSQEPMDGVEKNNAMTVGRPDIRVQFTDPLDNAFDAWVAAQTKGWDNFTTNEISLPGVTKAVFVKGQMQASTIKGFDSFVPAPYVYYLQISQKQIDGTLVEYYVRAEAAATIIDYTNQAVPNPHPEESYPYATTQFKQALDQIVSETKWN